MTAIDFTNCDRRNKAYAGANGNKISIMYKGEQYMLKFPAHARKNEDMSYSNSCFSEYLGCQIYQTLKIPVQSTLLGTYKDKVVVACKDFTEPGIVLQDFASLKNQMIDSERQGYGTDIDDVLQTLEEQTAIDTVMLENRFWDMFVVDAFIGNWDRHNGNWGFLYNTQTDAVELAPVFDCGSCLYPQADKEIMKNVLRDPNEMKYRIYEVPTSALQQNGKRIKYYDFISKEKYPGCREALQRIGTRISMKDVNEIVDKTPLLSDLQREFYKTMLSERKRCLLDPFIKEL